MYDAIDDGRKLGILEAMLEAAQADGIGKIGFFRSDAYQEELCADSKLELLWKMLIPDPDNTDEEPMGFYWAEFDNFFS